MSELSGPRSDFHLCGTEFLLRDLELALTFLDLAGLSALPEHERRASAHALTAWQTVQKFLPRLQPGLPQQAKIQQKLALLESRMAAIGVVPGR